MTDDRTELLQGTLEMLVLKTLALEPMHGWGIAQRIQQMSQGRLSRHPGLALSRARADEAPRPGQDVVAHHGEQPARSLLRAHRRRPPPARGGAGSWHRASSAVNWIMNAPTGAGRSGAHEHSLRRDRARSASVVFRRRDERELDEELRLPPRDGDGARTVAPASPTPRPAGAAPSHWAAWSG